MPRSRTLLTLAAITATAGLAVAQNAYISAAAPASPSYTQDQPAPIERSNSFSGNVSTGDPTPQNYETPQYSAPNHQSHIMQAAPTGPFVESEPAPGVAVRSEHPVQTVSADAHRVELRLDHGRANVMVHDPSADTLILVDLPGGQTQLLKNGLYTFNADTNTVRVLHGEADAFLGATGNPLKVKEEEQIILTSNAQATHFDRYYARQDFLAPSANDATNQQQPTGEPAYGAAPPPVYGYAAPGYYGPYGDGYYANPYPYYAYDWGWGWGYPFFGFGWGGYYGGYRGGYYGYRGGYGGGIHGPYGGGPHPVYSGGLRGSVSSGGGFHSSGGGHSSGGRR